MKAIQNDRFPLRRGTLSEFLIGIRTIVKPLLEELGFRFDEYDGDADKCGRKAAVVFFSFRRLQDSGLRIAKHFPIAHEGILEMDGPEYWKAKP